MSVRSQTQKREKDYFFKCLDLFKGTKIVKVKQCKEGRGLFAIKNLPSGCVIATTSPKASIILLPRKKCGCQLILNKVEQKLRKLHLPTDLCIHVKSGSKSFIIVEYLTSCKLLYKDYLKWYAMNHSSPRNATTKMFVIRNPVTSDVERIEWRTRHDIKAGCQLTFNYGSPDPSWIDAK